MVTDIRSACLNLDDSEDVLHQRLNQLNQLRKSRHFCDVILQVGSAEIHAHRSVLSSVSPFFFELFTAEDESKSAREGRLLYKLNGSFDKESLEHLVTYAYTGVLEVPDHLVKKVYMAGNRLKMEQVVKACSLHLVAHLRPNTCLQIRAIPGISANPELTEQIDEFIQKQDNLVQITRDAIEISRIQLMVVHSTKDEAAITGRAICNLALEWVKKQMTDDDMSLESTREKGRRKSATPQPTKPRMLLYSRSITEEDEATQDADWKLIAFAQVSDNSWVTVVTLKGNVAILSIHQKLNTSPSASPQTSRPASVEKVDNYTVIQNMSSSKCATGTGNLNGRLLVCGGYDRGECLKTVETYSPNDNIWTPLPAMRHSRGRFDLTVLDGIAYAVGGSDGMNELSTVEMLEPGAEKWKSLAPLPLARSNTGVCNQDGKVLCIGGLNGHRGIKQCDIYDPATNSWQTIAPLNIGRYQAGVVALDNLVYTIGGSDSWNCLNSVEVYDISTNTWNYCAPMTTARRGCAAVVFKGKVYVMGGSDGTHSLCSTEIYQPATDSWTSGPPMTTRRANVGSAVVDGKLYVVGGFSGRSFLNTIEYLDPDTNEWTNFTQRPNLRNNADTSSEAESEHGKDSYKKIIYQDLLNGFSTDVSVDSN